MNGIEIYWKSGIMADGFETDGRQAAEQLLRQVGQAIERGDRTITLPRWNGARLVVLDSVESVRLIQESVRA